MKTVQAQLVTFDVANSTANQSSLTPSTASDVSATDLVRSGGITTESFWDGEDHAFVASQWSDSESRDGNKYFSFTVSPANAGEALDLSQLQFSLSREYSTSPGGSDQIWIGPGKADVTYVVGGTEQTLASGLDLTNSGDSNGEFHQSSFTLDLSSIPNASGTVEIRFYLYDRATDAEASGISSGASSNSAEAIGLLANGPPGSNVQNAGGDVWRETGSDVILSGSVVQANAEPTFTNGDSESLTVDEDAAATSLSSPLQVDDPDSGQTLEWTVSSAPSNGTLSGFPTTESSGTGIEPSGLTYEPNTDVVGSDVDAFDIQASDGIDAATITINVTVNNLAPVFNSSNTASVQENSTGTVLDVNADNGGDGANDSGVDYAITGGSDSGELSINTSTGELSFDSAPDFESPTDSDTNNDYVVDVTADDGESSNNTTTQTITVTVTDVNEAPTVTTNSGLTLDEGATETIGTGTLSADDVDAGDGASDLTFSVTSAVSNGTLFIDGSGGGTEDGTLDGEAAIGTGSFTQANIENGNLLYAHDGSETTSDSFTFDLTDDDGAGSMGETFSISITAQNDAPTISSISDQTIEEDGTLSSLSFTVDDAETSDLSTLTLSGSSDNTTLVPNSNISFTGPDASGNASITVNPASIEAGTATITVTVDDGAGTNNTASEDFTLTVLVPLTITDGSASELDFTADVSPGTDNNAVGIFGLSAGETDATLEAVTVTNNSPGVSGITNARLYLSADQSLVPVEDSEEASFDVTDNSAEAEFDFTGIGSEIPTGGYFVIIAIDVASGASASGIQFSLDQASDLSVSGGEIATVNGSPQSTFSALELSNGTTALPVELARFDATTSENEAVSLQWQTASETDNAGFEVQRRTASTPGARKIGSVVKRDGSTGKENWKTVGSVSGAGTTDEAQSYRFTDTDVPYDADSLTYRLKQVDTDGSAGYSEPITIARSGVETAQLLGTFPNPARQRATVRFAIPDETATSGATLRLYDTLGRQVRTVQAPTEAGRHTVQLETARLPSGVYFLRLQAGTTVKTQRLTVVR